MEKKLTSILVDEEHRLTLQEFCQLASADKEVVLEMIEFGVLEPEGSSTANWQFSYLQLRRYKQAERLRHDLHLNLAGVALSLDLLEQLKTLRKYVIKLEHQLKLSGQG